MNILDKSSLVMGVFAWTWIRRPIKLEKAQSEISKEFVEEAAKHGLINHPDLKNYKGTL